MNFSHIYEYESFYEHSPIDCTEITGTDGYCSPEALASIRSKISEFPAQGIHFIDNGNYHYVSGLWIEKITAPFNLVVFDNHTDFLDPVFGSELVSCGSWLKSFAFENPYVKRIIMIGPHQKSLEGLGQEYLSKLTSITFEDILAKKEFQELELLKSSLPIYISIDTDVLDKAFVHTNWDQGIMKPIELLRIISFLSQNDRIIGIDVCGESSVCIEKLHDISENDRFNELLLHFLRYTITKNDDFEG